MLILFFQDTFDIFDRQGEGQIATHECTAIFTALGLEVSTKDIEAAIQEANHTRTFSSISH